MEWTSRANVGAALTALGVLRRPVAEPNLEVLTDWHRGGAETYVLQFRVHTSYEDVQLALKACVAFSPGRSATEVANDWLTRRHALAKAGVSTPRLFGASRGTLLEEWIPYDALDRIATASEPARRGLLQQAGFIIGTCGLLGFRPVSLADWRSRGTDLVVIDFGQDLGPPNVGGIADCSQITSDYVAFLQRSGIHVSGTDLSVLEAGVEDALSVSS